MGFVVISIKQYQIARCNQCAIHHFVGGACSIKDKVGPFGIENMCCILFRLKKWPAMIKYPPHIGHKIEIGTKKILAKIIKKNPPKTVISFSASTTATDTGKDG